MLRTPSTLFLAAAGPCVLAALSAPTATHLLGAHAIRLGASEGADTEPADGGAVVDEEDISTAAQSVANGAVSPGLERYIR